MASGFPSMTALLGLLAVAGYQNRDKLAEMLGGGSSAGKQGVGSNRQASQGGNDGLLGGLGGLLGGSTAGGLLGGGLSELVERFQESGHGEKAQSWVRQGPNERIEARELERAIGPEALATLTERTGLSRDELLKRLSVALPDAVDKYTPDGRLPPRDGF